VRQRLVAMVTTASASSTNYKVTRSELGDNHLIVHTSCTPIERLYATDNQTIKQFVVKILKLLTIKIRPMELKPVCDGYVSMRYVTVQTGTLMKLSRTKTSPIKMPKSQCDIWE